MKKREYFRKIDLKKFAAARVKVFSFPRISGNKGITFLTWYQGCFNKLRQVFIKKCLCLTVEKTGNHPNMLDFISRCTINHFYQVRNLF